MFKSLNIKPNLKKHHTVDMTLRLKDCRLMKDDLICALKCCKHLLFKYCVHKLRTNRKKIKESINWEFRNVSMFLITKTKTVKHAQTLCYKKFWYALGNNRTLKQLE